MYRLDQMRGAPEGIRLSPTLFGIFVADLIHKLKAKFPNATITHNGGPRWIGGILHVDDLCLISTDAHEFQLVINACQTWSEKAQMQLNADKTKIMCFHFTRVLSRQGHIAPKRDYEALWQHPIVATRAPNPHAASLARRPVTMKVHELRILVRRDGRSGRTQKESRRTENETAPANAHGGALGIDIMKRCGRPPGTTTQHRPRECTDHRTRGRMPAEKACTAKIQDPTMHVARNKVTSLRNVIMKHCGSTPQLRHERATNPHAASLARRPGTMKVHKLFFFNLRVFIKE